VSLEEERNGIMYRLLRDVDISFDTMFDSGTGYCEHYEERVVSGGNK